MRNEHLLSVNLNERPREDTPVLENCTSCCDVYVNTCSHIVKLFLIIIITTCFCMNVHVFQGLQIKGEHPMLQ